MIKENEKQTEAHSKLINEDATKPDTSITVAK